MGDVVNLNKFRKQKKRDADRDKAGENRTKFGRNKSDKNKEKQHSDRTEADLSGKKIVEKDNQSQNTENED